MSGFHRLLVFTLLALAASSISVQTLDAATAAPPVTQPAQTAPMPSHIDLTWLKDSIVSDVKAALKAEKDPKWKDPTALLAVGALLLSFASLAFSFFQFRRNRSDTLDWKERDARANRQAKLLESLKWFEGGIQNRAIGIAVIEGHWDDQPELRPTWASLLVAQAVYILSKPESELPQHETRNLQRILALLRQATADIPAAGLGATLFQPIDDVLAELPTKKTKPKEGKELAPADRAVFMDQVHAAVSPYSDLLKVPALPRSEA